MLTTRLPGTIAITTFSEVATKLFILSACKNDACCLGIVTTSYAKTSVGKGFIVAGSKKMLLFLKFRSTRSI
jgi:hypothetical protein